jgi:hypothetical protein
MRIIATNLFLSAIETFIDFQERRRVEITLKKES